MKILPIISTHCNCLVYWKMLHWTESRDGPIHLQWTSLSSLFFLDHIIKLVHVNPIHLGGGRRGGVHCARSRFFVCCGSIRDLKKALEKSHKSQKRVKEEIGNYTIFISTSKVELQIQFPPTTKLNIWKMLSSDIFHSRKFGQSKNYKP